MVRRSLERQIAQNQAPPIEKACQLPVLLERHGAEQAGLVEEHRQSERFCGAVESGVREHALELRRVGDDQDGDARVKSPARQVVVGFLQQYIFDDCHVGQVALEGPLGFAGRQGRSYAIETATLQHIPDESAHRRLGICNKKMLHLTLFQFVETADRRGVRAWCAATYAFAGISRVYHAR
jgi:hypothetical protein